MNNIYLTFLKGLAFGISMAAIPGPIFFLIVQRTLIEGPWVGLFCGFGAITADALYAITAAVGLTFISNLLYTYQQVLMFIGSFFLLYLGISIFTRPVAAQAMLPTAHTNSIARAWLSTFVLTLTNPLTIVSYTIVFAALGLGTTSSTQQEHSVASLFVTGVIIGALLVVCSLIAFLTFFRHNLSTHVLRLINKTAGLLLIIFAIISLSRGIAYYYFKC